MNKQNLIELNESIFNSIKSYPIAITKNEKLSKKINSLSNKAWFKLIFENFCSFYAVANKKHPDFNTVLCNSFTDKLINKCVDIDKTYEYIKKNNMIIHDSFVNSIKKFFTEEEVKKINYYDDPEETRYAVRFLDHSKKWNIRKTKREQVILKEINSKVSFDVNNSINSICHNSKILNEYIKSLKEKKKSMESINCNELAAEIDQYINRVEENINLSKYGFFRVSISKLLEFASGIFSYRGAEIFPIKDKNYLEQFPIPNFIELCDNFFGKNLGIFDHYAHIKFSGGPFSFLIGEIDSKSYFLGLIYE